MRVRPPRTPQPQVKGSVMSVVPHMPSPQKQARQLSPALTLGLQVYTKM